MVPWLGFHTSTAGAWVQSPAKELRSHKPCNVAKKEEKSTNSKHININHKTECSCEGYHFSGRTCQCNKIRKKKRNET